jgi:hypothetical protein
MITKSGKHIQIMEKRHCRKCGVLTDQVCHRVRYQENPKEPTTLIKKSEWICPICLTDTEEVKTQSLPSDKVRIITRLLRMQEDYAIQSMSISSQSERLVIEMTVKD